MARPLMIGPFVAIALGATSINGFAQTAPLVELECALENTTLPGPSRIRLFLDEPKSIVYLEKVQQDAALKAVFGSDLIYIRVAFDGAEPYLMILNRRTGFLAFAMSKPGSSDLTYLPGPTCKKIDRQF